MGKKSTYVHNLKKKFIYMSTAALFNRSARCMSIFLSYFTSPVWKLVGCEHKLKSNYFVCERKADGNKSNNEYIRSSLCCPTYYTYVNGLCWHVSTKVKKINLPIVTVQLSKLFSLLTAWSLGDSTRTTMWVQLKHKHLSCLKTDDFDFQRYKDWVVSSDCKSTYLLGSHSVLTYSKMCLGMV